MRRTLLFGSGMAVGYVLGARAGRERYEEIVRLLGALPERAPRSVTDLTGPASRHAERLTESARTKAHDVIDLADAAVDDAAERADEVRRQTEERLNPS